MGLELELGLVPTRITRQTCVCACLNTVCVSVCVCVIGSVMENFSSLYKMMEIIINANVSL